MHRLGCAFVVLEKQSQVFSIDTFVYIAHINLKLRFPASTHISKLVTSSNNDVNVNPVFPSLGLFWLRKSVLPAGRLHRICPYTWLNISENIQDTTQVKIKYLLNVKL